MGSNLAQVAHNTTLCVFGYRDFTLSAHAGSQRRFFGEGIPPEPPSCFCISVLQTTGSWAGPRYEATRNRSVSTLCPGHRYEKNSQTCLPSIVHPHNFIKCYCQFKHLSIILTIIKIVECLCQVCAKNALLFSVGVQYSALQAIHFSRDPSQ